MKNIAIFFGGQSVERDVSVITGVLTSNSLDKTKFYPIPIYIDEKGCWYTGSSLFDIENYKSIDLKRLIRVTFKTGENVLYRVKKNKLKPFCNIAVGINCIHGENGEDGSLSGYLKTCFIPFASPDLFASATFMDKEFTKIFLKGLKIKHLPYAVAKSVNDAEKVIKNLTYPLIIKPATLGSSIGIKIARNFLELKEGLSFALRYGEKAIVETYLENNKEVNCAVYRDTSRIYVSECEMPLKKGEMLGFDDKYVEGERMFPAKIKPELADKIKRTAKIIYEKSGAEGIIRIDFLIKDDTVYVNEINGVPGSLSYYLFCDTMEEFSKILTAIILRAEQKYAKDKSAIKKFSSSVLNIKGIKGSKHLKKP